MNRESIRQYRELFTKVMHSERIVMAKSRTYNSIMNSIFGIGASAVTVILNFFVRIILVRQLGAEINGLHNLFQSIVSVMSLMELGISTAMIIHLYEPVKNNDIELIKGIMSFYRTAYRAIAGIFLVVCIFVDIFLMDRLVTTTVDMILVRTYFLLFGLSFVVNYLTYYKRSILFAEQKNRISMGVTAACEIVFRSIQILLLIVFHQYIIFLILWIAEKATGNTICALYVNKRHPYLKHNHAILAKEKKQAIFNTVKPIVVNQAANTVRLSARSILISILLGNVSIVGYYGNYQLVISMIEMIYTQFGGAFTTSFGNLAVENDKVRMVSAYKKAAFVMNWFACIMCAGFFVCIQDFIFVFFGQDFVLDIFSVISLLITLIIYLLNIPIISIQNAMGLHSLDAAYMVVQTILSIVLGYIGGVTQGMPGIFIGLLIPVIIFTTIRKGVVICKNALGMDHKDYILFIVKELMEISITIIAAVFACKTVTLEPSILSFVVKGVLAVIIGAVLPGLLSFRTDEFKYAISLLKKIFGKVFHQA